MGKQFQPYSQKTFKPIFDEIVFTGERFVNILVNVFRDLIQSVIASDSTATARVYVNVWLGHQGY
jgi:hypothetical protein